MELLLGRGVGGFVNKKYSERVVWERNIKIILISIFIIYLNIYIFLYLFCIVIKLSIMWLFILCVFILIEK